ncbi:MAG: hypothetical protein EHM35_17065 [Planctomycetaceae bacterium]|nr:MAG: hypothetical protein EHM35_17065 [Planctomycetaceae bacterium]
MGGKTRRVYDLVAEVLCSIPKPYSEDITDDVCLAIQHNPQWQQRYQEIAADLRAWVVNNWIGVYTCRLTFRRRGRQVIARSSLIKTYSKLVT